MADELGSAAHQLMGGHPLDLHRVIGDEPVPALDEFDCRLTLAHAGLTHDEHALAVDLHQHAVAGDPGGEVGPQGHNERPHKRRGGLLRAENGAVIFLRHLHALRERRHSPGNDESGDILGQELFKDPPALLPRQAVQVGVFHLAQHLDALGIEIVKKADQLKAGPVYILCADETFFISAALPQDLQIKVLDQLGQFHAVQAFQYPSLPSYLHFRLSIAPAPPEVKVEKGSPVRGAFASFSVYPQ